MFTSVRKKLNAVSDKINTAQAFVFTTFLIMSSNVVAGGAEQAAQGLTGTMTAILQLMPMISRIAGIVVIIGGLWSLYQHYKSQGRDGSVAAGLAGIVVGVGLFFLGGLLAFGADTLGIEATTALPQ